MYIPELLAPVGSKESLIAAIDNGANAVYFGGTLFGARQYASNFKREELEWAIDYSHVRGIKTYVTVNTLIKDSELEEAADYLQFICNAGADAVIVQDIGILKLLREQLPELPVHASTQMTIHNVQGVKFLQEMGVKRVVLARENSLEEIRIIKSETGIEVETFIHGALCFSYSGQCLLSSMIGGRSGNRGYCAQPCRKKYRMIGIEGYLLSPKDLNMSELIPSLIEAGIDSFKIEGRMKRPEYVAGVVRIYRMLIDRYFASPEEFWVAKEEKHILRQLFNREFTTGYFFGDPGSDLMSRRYPHNRGTELGKIIDYDPRSKTIVIQLKAPLRTGDGIGIGCRESGMIVNNIFADSKRVNTASSGTIVKIPMEYEVAKGDIVFKTYDSQLMASLEAKNLKKIPIKMSFIGKAGKRVELRIIDGDNDITIRGGNVSPAEKRPLSESSITEQLKKLGNTVFEARKIDLEIDDNIFIPVSELNSLRRDAITKLEQTRIEKWKHHCNKPDISDGQISNEPVHPVLSVNTGSIESFESAVDGNADIVYFGEGKSGVTLENDDYSHAIEYGRKNGVKVFINLPRIMKNFNDLPASEYFSKDDAPDGFLAADPGVLFKLHKLGKTIVVDYPLNVFNRLAMAHLLEFGQRVTLSPELTLTQMNFLASFGQTECIVHGFFPLMVSEHDLIGGLFSDRREHDFSLKDEKGFLFPVRNDSQNRTYIMNSRELCMLDHIPELLKSGVSCLRIEARMYDATATGKITRAYRDAIDSGRSRINCNGEYTTGHYFRGVL
ncbi:MAG: U32 family peptidase [Candidatus Methanoperedens sp.]|nr:U32 family peptidase [Candidatus Methanoperedens sp.]